MKKYILLLAVSTVALSCKKIQAGGNLGVIKIEPGVSKYTDEDAPKPTYVAKPDSLKMVQPKLVEPNLDMEGNSKSAELPAMAK